MTDKPTDEGRIALYNAACKYAYSIMSDRIDFDEAMRLAQELEDAAVAFSEFCISSAPAGEKQANPPDAGASGTPVCQERKLR